MIPLSGGYCNNNNYIYIKATKMLTLRVSCFEMIFNEIISILGVINELAYIADKIYYCPISGLYLHLCETFQLVSGIEQGFFSVR